MNNSSQKNLSIIDTGLIIKGDVNSNGSLVIKGRLEGTLNGENIVIAEDGYVAATIESGNMTIAGSFEGEASIAGVLSILATGNCSGKITCGALIVEKGGVLNAQVSNAGQSAGKISGNDESRQLLADHG